MMKAIVNGHIFDGDTLLQDHAVIIENEKVKEVLPQHRLPKGLDVALDLKGNIIVPGFIDLQVNGGGGVMFNNNPTVEGIQKIAEAHRRFGTTGLLPTLITDDYKVMRKAIESVTNAISQGVRGILGIHLEGPFLNPDKKGVHDDKKFCVIDDEGFDIITSLKTGKTLLTIAPELTSHNTIQRIRDAGIIVSAGHSAANFDEACAALEAGVSGFTHLFNAMTPLQSRAPGMVGAALHDDSSWFGIIADGFHIHPAAFRVAVAAKQQGGTILVTDAMASVGAIDKQFVLDGETIHVQNGRCTNAAGALAGSDLDMNTAVKNAMKFARIDWMEAVRMASTYPAKAIGLGHRLGFIKPGYDASFTCLDENQNVIGTF